MQHQAQYRSSCAALCCREACCTSIPGRGAVIEHGVAMAEDQGKLSHRVRRRRRHGPGSLLLREQEGRKPGHQGARRTRQIDEKVYRSNLIEERIQEMIEDGTILIDIAGEKVGQINGLAVMALGDYAFGRPSRVTASIGVGREGHRHRPGGQDGRRIHNKGVLMLSGFLDERYAQRAASLTARLVFEQSYSGVDGDSASSTELYALLSALGGMPIRQDIAVTGSVNQKGQVQAIGGVNQKIEGFYEVCKARGLTGGQGCRYRRATSTT